MQFSAVEHMDYHHHCVLSMKHVVIEATSQSCVLAAESAIHLCHTALLCTAATDGQLAFWDVTPALLAWVRARSQDADSAVVDGEQNIIRSAFVDPKASARKEVLSSSKMSVFLCSVRAHQSGVNDVAIKSTVTGVGKHELLVASVGDDGALVITRLEVMLGHHGSFDMNYSSPKLCVAMQLHEPGAHHSSITGEVWSDDG